jgi:hypothetical protein
VSQSPHWAVLMKLTKDWDAMMCTLLRRANEKWVAALKDYN